MQENDSVTLHRVDEIEKELSRLKMSMDEHKVKIVSFDVLVPSLVDMIGELKTVIKNNSEAMTDLQYQTRKINDDIVSLKDSVGKATASAESANKRGHFDVINFITINAPSLIVIIYIGSDFIKNAIR